MLSASASLKGKKICTPKNAENDTYTAQKIRQMITTFDSTRIALIAKYATLDNRDGQVWLCFRQ